MEEIWFDVSSLLVEGVCRSYPVCCSIALNTCLSMWLSDSCVIPTAIQMTH